MKDINKQPDKDVHRVNGRAQRAEDSVLKELMCTSPLHGYVHQLFPNYLGLFEVLHRREGLVRRPLVVNSKVEGTRLKVPSFLSAWVFSDQLYFKGA